MPDVPTVAESGLPGFELLSWYGVWGPAGMPEPVVQHEVFDGGRRIARIDLAYPELRIAIEYEGDGHRTDKEQWRRDIQRQRDLEDRGWIVIRLTQRDLHEGRESLITRIRRAIRG